MQSVPITTNIVS